MLAPDLSPLAPQEDKEQKNRKKSLRPLSEEMENDGDEKSPKQDILEGTKVDCLFNKADKTYQNLFEM